MTTANIVPPIVRITGALAEPVLDADKSSTLPRLDFYKQSLIDRALKLKLAKLAAKMHQEF